MVQFATTLLEPIRLILRLLSDAGVGRPVKTCHLRAVLRKAHLWGENRLNGYLQRSCRLLVALEFVERGRGGESWTLFEHGAIASMLPPVEWGVDVIQERLAGKPFVPSPRTPLVPGEDPWWVVPRRRRRRKSTCSSRAARVARVQDAASANGAGSVPEAAILEATRWGVKRSLFPSYREIELPLLRELTRRGGSASPGDLDAQGRTVYAALADAFELPTAAREQRTRDGKNRSRWENRVRFGRQRLLKRGFVLARRRGCWEVTPIGFKHLEAHAKDANGKRTLL
jgi:hypothetical protein